jgi:phosphoribosylformylglycinamidine synthase
MVIMKAKVFVALKRTVLDPQGKTILAALRDLGYTDVADVRQGKFFEIGLSDGLGAEQARQQIERIARDVLTNPVIEEFSYQMEP